MIKCSYYFLFKDLLKFIEQSEHGVIYISLGSMINGASFPKEKLKAILDALAELPQRVVWKWEAKSLPGKPKNIFVSKWLPQNDLLGEDIFYKFSKITD